jgi:localization factor PodJL
MTPAPAPAPAQDLTNLEGQLRRITEQIETLRRPGGEEAIADLRAELGEIGRALDEAMPRRAIETIEKQIQGLAYRIAEGREAGVDGRALAGIEYGLAEVRDAVRGLTPAENLIGHTEAIDALAYKIDLIVAQRDPAMMQQLEKSIGTLREMAAHVASNETMSSLSAQVQALSDKIEHLAIGGGAGDALNRLELRIDALSRAVSESANNGAAVPPRLEGLIRSLSEKIEQIHQSRGDHIALSHLEDLIAKLVKRLDVTESRLDHLDAIERGLTDLLVHIEDMRANRDSTALRAESTSRVDLLKQDMARTQDTLEGVHGSLDRVADRLAVIEKDIRGERQKVVVRDQILDLSFGSALPDSGAVIPETAPPLSPNPPLQMPVASAAPDCIEPDFAPEPSPPVSVESSNKSLRPASQAADHPLEPGSGRPGFGTHPGIRIAASEAALGVARPNSVTPGSKSSFIAAARRAAQAASQDPKNRQARSESLKIGGGENAPVRAKVATRVKGMLLAASIVAIIVGSIQVTSNIFDFGFDSSEVKLVSNPETDNANSDTAIQNAENDTAAGIAGDKPDRPGTPDADITATLLAPPTLPSLTPASPAPKTGPAAVFDTGEGPSLALNPPLLNPPFLGRSAPKSDVTGSVARQPAEARPSRQTASAAQPPATDGLPAAIGGARLRNAASAGDPAAAYEVAMRFIEGRGVPANLEEAARWYERAASKGLAPAQFRYASMLEKGQGVKKDLGAAQKLYVAAANKGHAKAMHNLAVIYAEGAEGRPDYASAAQWFRKAADHGVADSQYNLAVLATRGLGTEKNFAESYKWFALAAAQGDRDAIRKRDDVAAHLDAETLAAAQEAVKGFAVQPQPAAATVVPEPPGGWDRTTPPHEKPRAAGPLSISAFNSGKL